MQADAVEPGAAAGAVLGVVEVVETGILLRAGKHTAVIELSRQGVEHLYRCGRQRHRPRAGSSFGQAHLIVISLRRRVPYRGSRNLPRIRRHPRWVAGAAIRSVKSQAKSIPWATAKATGKRVVQFSAATPVPGAVNSRGGHTSCP